MLTGYVHHTDAELTRLCQIPLSQTWGLLSRNSKRLVLDMYRYERRNGFSINDARYFANARIDQLRDIEKG